jgi:hypothetical protein
MGGTSSSSMANMPASRLGEEPQQPGPVNQAGAEGAVFAPVARPHVVHVKVKQLRTEPFHLLHQHVVVSSRTLLGGALGILYADIRAIANRVTHGTPKKYSSQVCPFKV